MNKVAKTISVVKLLKMFSTEHKAVKWFDKERAKYSVCRFMYIIPQKKGNYILFCTSGYIETIGAVEKVSALAYIPLLWRGMTGWLWWFCTAITT